MAKKKVEKVIKKVKIKYPNGQIYECGEPAAKKLVRDKKAKYVDSSIK